MSSALAVGFSLPFPVKSCLAKELKTAENFVFFFFFHFTNAATGKIRLGLMQKAEQKAQLLGAFQQL